MNLKNFQLQFITHFNDSTDYVESALLALEGGCRWIQLRMKDASVDEVRAAALQIMPACRKVGATFIIDDHVELVKEIGADGVHVGKNDMPVNEARKILGNGFIIGGTANTIDDVEMHYRNGASYIGCGPFRFTTPKKNLSPTLGLDGYRSIIGAMMERGIDIPLVAIGGITSDDVPSIMETGVCGIALSGTILNAENPASMTANLLQLISDAKEKQ